MDKIIAVDFDGTLNNENVFPDTGTPNMSLIQDLITYKANCGVKLILNTCRNGKPLAAAVDFCRQYGLEFDAVNENLPSVIESFGGKDTRKIVASLYIDDRAVTPQEFILRNKRTDKDLNNMIGSEYSERFDVLRKNRVNVSFFKYGPAKKNFGEGRVDALKTAELCIDAFKKDHNTEHLIDAANYLMFRFMYPLPGEGFRSTGADESVGTVGTPINMERD